MRRRRRIWRLIVTLAALDATRADAAEPDLSAPSVCAPPCPGGQTCVGSTCVGARPRTAAPTPAERPSPPPPAGSAPTSGPQMDHSSGAPPGNAPPPSDAADPPRPAPRPRPRREGHASPRSSGIQAPAPAPPRGQKRGFLALPYIGMHSYQHAKAATYDPGLRLGGFIGGRFNDTASLNLELTFDYSNVASNVAVPAPTFREWVLDFVVSPLFRLPPSGSAELVLGPKAGLFVSESTPSFARKWGFVLGVNMGLFMPISPTTSFGLLLSFGWKHTLGGCADIGGAAIGGADLVSCGIARESRFAQVFGLTGAAMF
jgi:hypothetical protein